MEQRFSNNSILGRAKRPLGDDRRRLPEQESRAGLRVGVYARDLDHYRYTARSRYRRLLERCPQVVQMLSLKDIASFLNVTPVYRVAPLAPDFRAVPGAFSCLFV